MRRGAPWLLAGLLLAIAAVPSVGSLGTVTVAPTVGYGHPASAGSDVVLSDNTTDNLLFVPNVLSASPTSYPAELDVLVTNRGIFPHTFTVAAQSNYSLSPSNFTVYLASHPPLVSANVSSGAGKTVWANFTVSAPGVYEFICEVSGHFASGMYGYLYVGVPLPSSSSSKTSPLVPTWVLVAVGVLVVVGIAVALLLRSRRKPPRPSGAPADQGGSSPASGSNSAADRGAETARTS